MNNIIIESNKQRFVKKSFLKYNKDDLIENLKHEIIKENLEKAYLLLFDMINSGFFNEIWQVYIYIYCEYIHILNPYLLKTIWTNYQRFQQMKKNARDMKLNILDARNEFNFRKILFMILKKILKTPKKHIGYFVPQSFNNQNKITSHTPLLNIFDDKNIPNLNILKEVINNQDYKDVEHAMKEFHYYVDFSIHKSMTFDQEKFEAKNNCFYWLAKILVIGAENTNIIGYPYNISLYHSIDPNSKDYFSPLVWNIILNGSKKLGKDYFNHIVMLYKIFNSKVMKQTNRENFLVIQAVLLFFEHILWTPPNILLLQDDYDFLDELYQQYANIKSNNITKPPKLKSHKVIEENKDDIEKIITQRQQEIADFIPKPPDNFVFETITKSNSPKINKKRKRNRKGKIIYDSDDPEIQLPDIFYEFTTPTDKDFQVYKDVQSEKYKLSQQFRPIKPIPLINDKSKSKSKIINSLSININKD